MIKFGIYSITNKINGKRYIGSVKQRISYARRKQLKEGDNKPIEI